MTSKSPARAYKDVTLQQLRSFCETARLGSLKAAADALGLAHPTVWQQVHALERELNVSLIHPHGRGCRVTLDGERLLDMTGTHVAALESLKQRFRESRSQVRPRLTVVTSQRFLTEDLPPVILEYERRSPDVLLCFREVPHETVVASVQEGSAEANPIGLCATEVLSPHVEFEPIYELDPILVMPRKHPLIKKKKLALEDLLDYPFVNLPGAFPGTAIKATLDRLGIFRTEPRRVEATYTASIRRYVEMGFGLGMVVGLPGHGTSKRLYERSLANQLGRIPVMIIWRKHTELSPIVQVFIAQIRRQLGRSRKRN